MGVLADAYTKDCETHPKQCDRNIKIYTVFTVLLLKRYPYSVFFSSSFRLLKIPATVPVCIFTPILFPLKYHFSAQLEKKCPFSFFLFKHQYQADQQGPTWGEGANVIIKMKNEIIRYTLLHMLHSKSLNW